MAFDEALAERLRRLLAGRRGVTEKAMFGGLAFLLDAKMFCGILGDELLARVGPDAHDAAMAKPHVRIMDFTGRSMRGYVFVGPAAVRTHVDLARWVDQCHDHAATLPDKPKKRPTSPGRGKAKPRQDGARRKNKAARRSS